MSSASALAWGTSHCSTDTHVIHVGNLTGTAGREMIVVVKVLGAAGTRACAASVIIKVPIHEAVSRCTVQYKRPRQLCSTVCPWRWLMVRVGVAMRSWLRHVWGALVLRQGSPWSAFKTLATGTATCLAAGRAGLAAGWAGLGAGWAGDRVHFAAIWEGQARYVSRMWRWPGPMCRISLVRHYIMRKLWIWVDRRGRGLAIHRTAVRRSDAIGYRVATIAQLHYVVAVVVMLKVAVVVALVHHHDGSWWHHGAGILNGAVMWYTHRCIVDANISLRPRLTSYITAGWERVTPGFRVHACGFLNRPILPLTEIWHGKLGQPIPVFSFLKRQCIHKTIHVQRVHRLRFIFLLMATSMHLKHAWSIDLAVAAGRIPLIPVRWWKAVRQGVLLAEHLLYACAALLQHVTHGWAHSSLLHADQVILWSPGSLCGHGASPAAGSRTIYHTMLGEERPAQQAGLTRVASKAHLWRMPVLPIMCHLALVHPDMLSASVTILSKHILKARAAVGPAVSHDVPLATQLPVTLQAAEVLHVPTASFSFCTLVSKNHLWEWQLKQISNNYLWEWQLRRMVRK